VRSAPTDSGGGPFDQYEHFAYYHGRESLRPRIGDVGDAEALDGYMCIHCEGRLLQDDEHVLATKAVGPTLGKDQFIANDPVAKLAAHFPWPAASPEVPTPAGPLGWLSDGAAAVLRGELTPATRVVVELGSWLGMSTRFIADCAPCATVIAIDHWQGSAEHHELAECRSMLPWLFENFLAMNWSYRHRVIPLKMTSIEGLEVVAAHKVVPDLIFMDADHRYEALLDDLNSASRLFPDAVLVGDDLELSEVRRAVSDFASQRHLLVQVVGENWRGWKLLARR
jgi:hypothetical protein